MHKSVLLAAAAGIGSSTKVADLQAIARNVITINCGAFSEKKLRDVSASKFCTNLARKFFGLAWHFSNDG